MFELVDHEAIAIDAQVLPRDVCDVADYALELYTILQFSGNGAVGRESFAGRGEGIRSTGARLGAQQWMPQAHDGSPSLRAGGDHITYLRTS
jgi:hypothetical protein